MKVKLLRKIRKKYAVVKLKPLNENDYIFGRYEVLERNSGKMLYAGFTIYDISGVVETIMLNMDSTYYFKHIENKQKRIGIRLIKKQNA